MSRASPSSPPWAPADARARCPDGNLWGGEIGHRRSENSNPHCCHMDVVLNEKHCRRSTNPFCSWGVVCSPIALVDDWWCRSQFLGQIDEVGPFVLLQVKPHDGSKTDNSH